MLTQSAFSLFWISEQQGTDTLGPAYKDQSAEHTEFGQKLVNYWSMHVWVGWCEFQLSINTRFICQECSCLSGTKVAEGTVDDGSFLLSLCWNFIIVRELFKTGETDWRINRVSNFAAMTWSESLGLNIPQIWILLKSKLCIELQVK